jgi:hypothetical protein
MGMALALEVKCDGMLLDAHGLAAGAVQDADGYFALRVVDQKFCVVILITEHDESAAVGADVGMRGIGIVVFVARLVDVARFAVAGMYPVGVIMASVGIGGWHVTAAGQY